jgi:hypothetical protein
VDAIIEALKGESGKQSGSGEVKSKRERKERLEVV